MNIAQARERAEAFIYVFCDDSSHPQQLAVTNFARIGGQWTEVPASRAARSGPVGTGVPMLRDAPAADGWALDPENANADYRERHVLVCRKCKGRRASVPARPETLWPLLDKVAADGRTVLSLADLVRILSARRQGS